MDRSRRPALVFDLDGVLVDSAELVLGGWTRFAREQGLSLGDDFRTRFFGRRTIDILQEAFGMSHEEAARLVAAGIDDKREVVAAGSPLSEISGATAFVLAARAGGWPLALASSASAANAGLALETLGLGEAFDAIVNAGLVARGKPDPAPYLAAAAALEVAPSEMVVFEDSIAGITAAKASGARCVAVASTEAADRLMATAADLVIEDFRGWTPDALLGELDKAAEAGEAPLSEAGLGA